VQRIRRQLIKIVQQEGGYKYLGDYGDRESSSLSLPALTGFSTIIFQHLNSTVNKLSTAGKTFDPRVTSALRAATLTKTLKQLKVKTEATATSMTKGIVTW
jgi:hypothetical protein